MSGSEGNFLTRWSRRKREEKPGEGAEPSPPCGERLAAERLGEGLPGPADQVPGNPSPIPSPQGGGEQTPFNPEDLPRLEDLTADSEVSAFLRAGVPEELKRAALRRMWSLDPAIRDFVSPAEYAWDFNDPDSIPGFGKVAGQLAAGLWGEVGSEAAPAGSEAVRLIAADPERDRPGSLGDGPTGATARQSEETRPPPNSETAEAAPSAAASRFSASLDREERGLPGAGAALQPPDDISPLAAAASAESSPPASPARNGEREHGSGASAPRHGRATPR